MTWAIEARKFFGSLFNKRGSRGRSTFVRSQGDPLRSLPAVAPERVSLAPRRSLNRSRSNPPKLLSQPLRRQGEIFSIGANLVAQAAEEIDMELRHLESDAARSRTIVLPTTCL
jgi:hypothetical protein